MCGIRIEDVEPQLVWAMHHFYETFRHLFQANVDRAGFWITGGRCVDCLDHMKQWCVLGCTCGESALNHHTNGNCSMWVTRGLCYAGLVAQPRMFPKDVIV